jgi:hypothetical protein
MPFLLIVGSIVAVLVVISKTVNWVQDKRIQTARYEYAEIEKQYGSTEGKEHCAHRMVEFSQTGCPGVMTMTLKWCKICGKNLGSAKLKESKIFGNKWV